MSRVLLVSQRPLSYRGSLRWPYFVERLPAYGWEIETVTSAPSVTGDPLSDDPLVARWSEARRRVMDVVGRIADPAAGLIGVRPEAFPPNFAWSFTGRRVIEAEIARTRPDVLVATSPPPSALFATAAVARRHDLPWIADLRDNWAGSPAYDRGGRLLRDLESRALSSAAAVVCVTDGMERKLVGLHPQLGSRLRVLPNGFPPDLVAMRRPWQGSTPVTLIHAGTLYADRSAGELLRALADPRLRGRTHLVLHGNLDRRTEGELNSLGDRVSVERVPPLPWRESLERVSAADIAVAIVPPGIGDDVAWPAKLLEALALGKPVLCLSSGGAGEQLLRELGQDAGCARFDDVPGITDAVLRLLDAPPPPVPLENLTRWDRERVTERYAALLSEVSSAS